MSNSCLCPHRQVLFDRQRLEESVSKRSSTWCRSEPFASSHRQVLVDRQRLEVVRRVEVGSTVAALLWHERLNQIFVGTGGLACCSNTRREAAVPGFSQQPCTRA